jgi:hypothetical protein
MSRSIRCSLRPGLGSWAAALLVLGACQNPDLQSRSFFAQRIAPVLDENCVEGTAGGLCHAESEQKPGEALGNLDLSSFEAIHRRPELLKAYGSYPEPALLLKAVKPSDVSLQYAGTTYEGEIFHAGGGVLSRNSEAFVELQQWLRDGATEDGVPPEGEQPEGTGPCTSALRPDVAPFLAQATGPVFDSYVADVEPILQARCSFGSCHGSSQSDFYLTCGASLEEQQHNFVVARSFVADPSDRSELLLRPLAPTAGGVEHSGGAIWGSASDGDFRTLRDWAAMAGPLEPGEESPEFQYFATHVMPALLRRGCAMPQCHSPQGFNDYRLRAGSRGFFSPLALQRNYETTLHEFVSLDSPDPNESRILKKNVLVEQGGIDHRAGVTLLDVLGADMGGDPTGCPEGEDEQPTSYCAMVEWIRRERAAAVDEGVVTALAEGDTVDVVYVDRPANADRLVDFATYRGGARLMRVALTVGPGGTLGAPAEPVEIDLTGCGAAADIDVRGPEVSWDGETIAFAMRVGEGDGLNVYTAALDGSGCTALTTDGGGSADGVPIHNFDPYFVPPDPERNPSGAIVFASTRAGKSGRASVSPRWKLPASNIWRMGLDGSDPQQMTFLNGSELAPALMQNGQVTMTTEKATDGFYQLAGRRINWDLTDYHPLLAQRDTIGFAQATEIREAHDRNFLMVLSNADARFGGGALASFNRSVGPFEFDREGEAGYVQALRFLDPFARDAGRGPSEGAYRSPYPAPDGSVLVAYAAGSLDLRDAGAAVDYDLVLLDPVTGQRTLVAGGAGFQIEGVVAMKRSLRHLFVNVPQLVFGGTSVAEAAAADEAWVHFPDLPMLATLLTNNRRAGRNLADVEDGDTLAVYLADAPPSGSGDDGSTFQSLSLLGTHALAEDGSAFVRAPAGVPVILELRRGDTPLLTMTEEHQFGPGELTSLGVSRDFFDGVCGGCHGSIAGPELDVVVDPDALTGASVSLSRPEPAAQPSGL